MNEKSKAMTLIDGAIERLEYATAMKGARNDWVSRLCRADAARQMLIEVRGIIAATTIVPERVDNPPE